MLFYLKPKHSTMAPSHSKTATKNGTDYKPKKEAILPLVPSEDEKTLSSENSLQFMLLSNPANADSPKYKVYCRILRGDEDVRTMINWAQDVERVIHGLAVADYNPRIQLAETMMCGTPLTIFQVALQHYKQKEMDRRIEAAAVGNRAAIRTAGVNHQDNQLPADVMRAVKKMLTSILPRKVLSRVKRYLRRECRKPTGMKVRTYMQHILRVNLEEIPMLPPYDPDQTLGDDEIMDIILFGTPKSWQKEMDRQGFDPMDHTVHEVVDFLENVEAAEDFEVSHSANNNKKDNRSKKGSSSSNSSGSSQKYCMLHGKGNHTTEECEKLKKEAKRIKSDAPSSTKSTGKFSKNKTWSKKAQEGKSKTQEDLAAFVNKAVAKAVSKASKKRKSDPDSDDEDLAAFDLKDFNYEDMENLKIDDTDVDMGDVDMDKLEDGEISV